MSPACKFCQAEITWRKEGDKSVPYNIDNTPHRCKKAAAPTTNTLIGRITEYEGSNVHLGSKIFFLTPEDRKVAQESFPVGSVVRFAYDKGTCKGMQKATGTDLEKFLKEEGEQRALPAQTPAPAAAAPVEPKETCTSPDASTESRKKGPIEECRMPTREELLAMVYSYDTYWKAKTLMDIQAHEEIRQQVEVKNWQECVNSAIEYHQRAEDGLSTVEDLNIVFVTATAIRAFIQGKTGGAP